MSNYIHEFLILLPKDYGITKTFMHLNSLL